MKRISQMGLNVLMGASMVVSPAIASEGLGNAYGDLRLRFETVDQNNAAKDATALTLRSRLGYASENYSGFSARLEVENNTSLIDDYFDAVNSGAGFSTVADPEFTELEQGYVQYQTEELKVKLGRQVVTFDNQRFIGHVGWRQDRQTFDGVSAVFAPTKDITVNAAYLEKRNRIFSDAKDIDSQDWLLNVAYQTGLGKFSTYAYLLEVDNNSSNSLDTYGVRYSGKTKMAETPLAITLELATQNNKVGAADNDTRYALVEFGTTLSGLNLTAGYELLGSDNGTKAFATPLATGHKFNGWTDQFLGTPAQGLVDVYLSLGGKVLGGKWAVTYHDFSADQATATIDDLGREVNLLFARKFKQGFSGGIKYGAYSAGDVAAGKVDTDKFWLWSSYAF